MTTRTEFEAAYASRSGVTVQFLHAHGRSAEPCECDDEMCEGWAMGHNDVRELSPRTFGEALNEAECPTCGAKPGENCSAGKPMPEGMTKAVHTARLYV